MYIAVKFNTPNPTTGLYNQLPQAVVDMTNNDLPMPETGKIWVKMSKSELNNYVEKVKEKTQQLTLSPSCFGITEIPSIDISRMSSDEISIHRNKIKRLFGAAFACLITDQLGGRNVDLKKDGAYVIKISTDLQPVASLLSNGALKTAYGLTSMIAPKYPEHSEIFDQVKQKLKGFLVSIDEW